MSSYWTAQNKIPIQQQSVSIPAENGTNHTATQEIRFNIDPSVKFFNPQESYFQADIKITPPFIGTSASATTNTVPCYVGLDAETGAQSLIRTIRIRDSNGVLLEEIDGYNTMVAMKYDYHTNDSLRNKRALREGATTTTIATRGTQGTTKSVGNSYINNPYFTINACNTETAFTNTNYIDAKVCLPLHTGIFQNDKIFPNMLVGGLQVSLLLEDTYRSFRTMDGANKFRRTELNPFFQSVDGTRTEATGSWGATGSHSDVFYLSPHNSQNGATKCPFVVGEGIGFFNVNASSNITFSTSGGTTLIPTIKSIGYEEGKGVKITLNQSVKPSASIATKVPGGSSVVVFSRSNENATQGATPKYEVKNSFLVLQQVDVGSGYEAEMMRKMKEGGKITYDFLSATNYKYSQLQNDVVANIRLPINNARCKSIIGIPTDATIYTMSKILECKDTYKISLLGSTREDYYLNSQRPGLEGISDFLTEYKFLYDGKLQPSRRVNVSKTSSKISISAQHLIELDKALSQAGITGHSMMRFNEIFCIGRALSLGDGVYDARNRDFSLQLNYGGTAPTKQKLWNFFVFHIRRLEISGNSVGVIV